ncbi:MAG: lipoprotein insertase outer membrane protein LolB [Gammaproteobacteria bacterium]|nr:lipoprotein insertase outer membrane protein LolB [Gammaproteobacteria bacterium]
MVVYKLLFLNVFFAAFCLACSTLGPVADGTGFGLRGKLGVVDGSESYSARFLWQQTGEVFGIDLWGPLGQGRVRLEGDGEHIVLSKGGEVLARGKHDEVMRTRLGWTLPLNVLPSWALGQPDASLGVAAQEYDDEGRLVAFEQLDWRVTFGQFRLIGERSLPRRITARRGDYRVRLIISTWNF